MSIQELVKKYRQERKNYLKGSYNETQLRNDFIDPLLKCLGWDVDNNHLKTHHLRDVIQEEYIEVEDAVSKKNPDYTLRINGTRKLFVEVKKPSVNILISAKAAFQTRRYGWNGNLGISILTNFEDLVIYDCRFKPDATDNESVARIKIYNHAEYEDAFEEIQNLISFQSAISGKLDDLFSVHEIQGQTFDDFFLKQIEGWRRNLATSAIQKNEDLDGEDLNLLIQRLLNRIIFLRICEDRTIEKFETLKNIQNYDDLKILFLRSDKKFNSGLFDFIEDTLSLSIEIDSIILIKIFNELYYPLSPYDFTVVDPTILSQIYERFLGSKVTISEDYQLSILEEPEVSASNGVVPTPKAIVEQIVKDSFAPVIQNKSFKDIQTLKFADICCGSGTFLISAFDFIVESLVQKYLNDKLHFPELIYQTSQNTFTLSLKAKRLVLEQNLFGVDINPYAVEVTEFSLLLKLLEGETEATVEDFINQTNQKVLPNLKTNIKCGNSLVDEDFFYFRPDALEDDNILFDIKPFNWKSEFPFLREKGFDAIIGNPPYVRIQNLKKYSPVEKQFYESEYGYTIARKDTIDKYYLFIQRAIGLLNDSGLLGYIVPHKFFLIKGGKTLRELITTDTSFNKIIHFGVTQVFPDRSTYTAIIILQKEKRESFLFKRIDKITPETLDNSESFIQYKSVDFKSDPWIFLSPGTKEVFDKIRKQKTLSLNCLADISVGLQTSKDTVYIFNPIEETANTYIFNFKDHPYEIEKGICLPSIYDLSFSSFDTIKANSQIIFPYIIENNRADLIDEEVFREDYPLAWKYLNDNKEILEKRNLQGKDPKWYQFGRSQSLTRFHNRPKLIWSVLATEAPYALDEKNIQFTGGGNGPYYALLGTSRYSLLYFMGILSHPIFEAMVKSGASEFRGSYYSHGKQFIENLPIKEITDKGDNERYNTIVSTVNNLIKTKESYKSDNYGYKRGVLERKMNILKQNLINAVNDLYQISEEEYNTVIHDKMFNTELTTEE